MARRFEEKELVIPSHNDGKVREIGELLQPYRIRVTSADARGLPEPEETGTTFAENAALKAHASTTRAACRPWRMIPGFLWPRWTALRESCRSIRQA